MAEAVISVTAPKREGGGAHGERGNVECGQANVSPSASAWIATLTLNTAQTQGR